MASKRCPFTYPHPSKSQTCPNPPSRPTTSGEPSSTTRKVKNQHLGSGSLKQRRLFLLLQSCNSISNLYQVHTQVVLHGFTQKSSLVHKLISCCVTCGDLSHAYLAFEHTQSPSVTVWNQMIRGFSMSPDPGKSVLLYNRLMKAEPREGDAVSRPNAFTYTFLLNACSDGSMPREGRQLHCRIVRSGFTSSVHVQTSLIDMYSAVGGAMRSARRVFDGMPMRNVATWNSLLAGYVRSGDIREAMRMFDGMPERDVVSWTTVIAGCARMKWSKRALALFRRMREVDEVTMVATLSACADLGDLELGRRIHEWADKRNKERRRTVNLDNSLINMYVKCGDVNKAYRIFQDMPRRSVVSWSTMIMGFVMHGKCEQALRVFDRMLLLQQQRVTGADERPDDVTFLGVLCACSRTEKPEEGLYYYKGMTTRTGNNYITPRMEHYCCVASMLSRAGRVDEALKLIETEMPVKPNYGVWGALLNGCRTHGDLRLASYVGNRLLELDPPGPDLGGQLAGLSNLYAASTKWDDALRLRRRMVEMRVVKPGGRSWVMVHGVVHEFTAGDQTRQCDPVVYSMVRKIADGAKSAGHVPHTSQVLLDVEEEEREYFLRLHCEKLAMAFGLINIADSRTPVRIMTNLCICSDCHSVAKYVSGTFERDIIIRERNRFHHFSGGTCSCKA